MANEIEQQEQAPDYPAEINVFVKTPQGFEGHIKVTSTARKAANHMRLLSEALIQQHFEPSGRVNGTSRPAPAAKAQEDDNPSCELCHGPTELVRGKAKNGKPWAGWFCINTKDEPKSRKHPPRWMDD